MNQERTTLEAEATRAWMDAMELFVGQLTFVLECEGGGFTAAKLRRWSQLCTQRMEETASVRPSVITEVRRMADAVAP